jgi:hypothetical protein
LKIMIPCNIRHFEDETQYVRVPKILYI